MELRPIADRVYACIQEDKGTGYSNSGLITGGSGLVVDTFFDLAHTRRMLEQYAGVWTAPPARLVNTHHNGDHAWGNQLLPWAEIIGHRRCAEALAADRPRAFHAFLHGPDGDPELEDLRARLSAFDFSEITIAAPTVLFDDLLVLDGCDTEVRLKYLGPAHTSSDVIVHLPEHGIVFAGDLVFRRCTPMGWEGSYAGWLAALDHIIGLRPEVIVPGHGVPCSVEGAIEMKAYLEYVYGEARRHFDADRRAIDAAQRIDLGPYAGWTEPDRLVFNVERAYAEFSNQAFDSPFDVLQRFRDMQKLRRFWTAAAR